MLAKRWVYFFILMIVFAGCTGGPSKPVQKLTKPIDQTAAELMKIRELKSEEGEARAVMSPADERKIKFTF